jgi:A/G-specific adenine glycosylase
MAGTADAPQCRADRKPCPTPKTPQSVPLGPIPEPPAKDRLSFLRGVSRPPSASVSKPHPPGRHEMPDQLRGDERLRTVYKGATRCASGMDRNPRPGMPRSKTTRRPGEQPNTAREGEARPAGARLRVVANALLRWYREHGRELPWRRSPDPYAVWVSEVMLQQTQVATVLSYYERWMRRFPTVQLLARASDDEVLRQWQGLGYYSRARSLLAGARTVVSEHNGEVPRDVSALRKLPGVGPYTAGAIASIAHGQDAAIVDGNVTRVLTRLFALPGDPTRQPLRARLWETAERLIPCGRAQDFNQALMDLGALVCTPRAPRCEECPCRAYCQAFAQGAQLAFPENAARPAATRLEHTAILLSQRGRVLVQKNAADARRWASMWLFPTLEQTPGEPPEQAALRCLQQTTGRQGEAAELLLQLNHTVTRFKIQLSFIQVRGIQGRVDTRGTPDLRWKRPNELEELAMPAAQRRLARWLKGNGLPR